MASENHRKSCLFCDIGLFLTPIFCSLPESISGWQAIADLLQAWDKIFDHGSYCAFPLLLCWRLNNNCA
jgi:hypothetical protein